MVLADQLGRVISIVEKLQIPDSHRADVLNLARFLKEQSLCDSDRRVGQDEISEAALLFVKRVHELSVLAALRQPQAFWDGLELFSKRRLEVKVSPARVIEDARKSWGVTDLFNHLLILVNGDPPKPVRDTARDHLKFLIQESKRPREKRDMQRERKAWAECVHPYLAAQGHLKALKGDKTLVAKLEFHLKGEWKKRETNSRLSLR